MMVSEHIQDLFKRVIHHVIYVSSPKVLSVMGYIEQISRLILVRDKAKIEYISEG